MPDVGSLVVAQIYQVHRALQEAIPKIFSRVLSGCKVLDPTPIRVVSAGRCGDAAPESLTLRLVLHCVFSAPAPNASAILRNRLHVISLHSRLALMDRLR